VENLEDVSNQTEEISFPQYQFLEARKKIDSIPTGFNVFVCSPGKHEIMKPAQQDFIKYIRNNITRNMMFSIATVPCNWWTICGWS
jgi:hypothetical protein